MLKSMNLSGACNLFSTTRITEPFRFGLPLAELPRSQVRQRCGWFATTNGRLLVQTGRTENSYMRYR